MDLIRLRGADYSENLWIHIGEADVLGVKIFEYLVFRKKERIFIWVRVFWGILLGSLN